MRAMARGVREPPTACPMGREEPRGCGALGKGGDDIGEGFAKQVLAGMATTWNFVAKKYVTQITSPSCGPSPPTGSGGDSDGEVTDNS